MSEEKRLLTTAEVAERLCVSKRTVYRLANLGQIPAVRMSKRLIRFDPDRVEKWIRESPRRPRPRRRPRPKPEHRPPESTCCVPGTEVVSAPASRVSDSTGGG